MSCSSDRPGGAGCGTARAYITQEVCSGAEQGRTRWGGWWCVWRGSTRQEKGVWVCVGGTWGGVHMGVWVCVCVVGDLD